MVVMVLGGFWHGAAMKFIAWGALHGTALCLERALGLHLLSRKNGHLLLKAVWFLFVQAVVLMTWILFRSDRLQHAAAYLSNIAHCRFNLPLPTPGRVLPFIGVVAIMHLRGFLVERNVLPPCGPREKAVYAGIMLFMVLTCYGSNNEFIYFQF
jgi:D-alanyl-lipoteichoic acid acyltransferase DltB (MBOAT superfamily)